jgi:hypothetical protein
MRSAVVHSQVVKEHALPAVDVCGQDCLLRAKGRRDQNIFLQVPGTCNPGQTCVVRLRLVVEIVRKASMCFQESQA